MSRYAAPDADNNYESLDVEVKKPDSPQKFRNPERAKKLYYYILTASTGFSYCFNIISCIYPDPGKAYGVKNSQDFNIFWDTPLFPFTSIMALVGGILIDCFGSSTMTKITLLFNCLGHLTILIGASNRDIYPIIAGKMVVEMVKQTLHFSQVIMVYKWFKHQRDFALKIALVFWVGNSQSFWGKLFWKRLAASIEPGFILTGIAPFIIIGITVLNFQATLLDDQAEKEDKHLEEDDEDTKRAGWRDFIKCRLHYFLFVAYVSLMVGSCELAAFNVYFTVSQAMGYANWASDIVFALISTMAGMMIYRFGNIVHNHGRRVYLMIVTSLFIIITQSMLIKLKDAFPHPLNVTLVLLMVGIAVYKSARCVIYLPIMPLLVPQKVLGFAYGFLFCIINFFDFLGSAIKIMTFNNIEERDKYDVREVQSGCLVFMALTILIALFIYVADQGHKHNLNRAAEPLTEEEEAALKAEEEAKTKAKTPAKKW